VSSRPPQGAASPGRKTPSGARLAAWRALSHAWDPKGRGVAEVLDEEAASLRLDPRDRALAREIAFGVLRNRFALEAEISQHLSEPVAPKSPRTHDALLMGAYQLIHLDRVPAHAAVSETVDLLATEPRCERFVGLANAILRKVARGSKPQASTDWRVRESIPEPVVEAVAAALPPEEVEAFAAASNKQAQLCLRVTKRGREDLEFQRRLESGALRVSGAEVPFGRGKLVGVDCLVLESGGFSPAEVAGFAEGWLTVEDEGAQVAAYLAGSGARGSVLDLCASPGGKTAHIADIAPHETRIVASDLNEAKIQRLEETLIRLGLNDRVEKFVSTRIFGGDFNGTFATVLVDAPCSGLGTLRRHPEIRYRFGETRRAGVIRTQSQLLKGAARLVAPGGVLIYTVCTVNRDECEGQVEAFLGSARDFSPHNAPSELPFDPRPLECGAGMWRTWPHRHGCDGFFVARLRRE